MTKVLVIEDDPAIRANIVDLLEVEGFSVVQAASGTAGVAAFRKERPDLVISDLKLPEMDGFAVLETLRREPEGGDTPFIFLSAHAERSQIRQGMKLGADDYIPKPFTSRELLDAVRGRLVRMEAIRSATPPPLSRTTPAFTPAPLRREQLPERFGNYRIIAQIGQGGMGAVFLAEHVLLGKEVAIKVLLPELSQSRENVGRFFNEARSAAGIRDPGIVDVFDFGYDASENAYIVMELLHGESLGAFLHRVKRPDLGFVVRVGKQIARAIGAAHARQIVHRDLKPDNVFLARDPDVPTGTRVKVLDFGTAKLGMDMGPGSVVTRTGDLVGTPLYMSPEQCRGIGEVDARADVYALGCILYELVCGRPPFVNGGIGMILGSHIYQPVPPPSSLVEVTPPLETLLLKALAKEPSQRQQTMAELAAELSALGET
jgi:serine/threonine protein kinase/ActR/RegA family two-component response regulator